MERDERLADASGFPALLAALEQSLDMRAQSARVARPLATLRTLVASASARVRRAASLAESDVAILERTRTRATEELAERERALSRERDEVARAGHARRDWVLQRGAALAERAMAARFGRSLVDHRTWVLASAPQLSAGLGQEAGAIAGANARGTGSGGENGGGCVPKSAAA